MIFNPKKKDEPKKKLTDAELLVIRKAKQEEREKDRVIADALGERLPAMSHRQLRNELKRVERGERRGKDWNPSLRISFVTALLAVFDNTQTSKVFETDHKGNPTRVARPDQINPKGRLFAYPR